MLSARPKPNGKDDDAGSDARRGTDRLLDCLLGDGRSMEYKGVGLGAGTCGTRDADKQNPHESKTGIDSRRCMPIVVLK
jgi:hypothetical protein